MTKPNVDWSEINWSQMVIHKTTAYEDNMRAVRMQFHGCHANAGDEALDRTTSVSNVEPASRLSLGAQAAVVVGDRATGNPQSTLGVGETIFSPEEIARFQAECLKLYEEQRQAVRDANGRYLEGDTEFSDSDIEDYYLGKAPT